MTTATMTKDPVCGMDVDPAQAAGSSEYAGESFHFCSASCKAKFDADPDRYVQGGDTTQGATSHAHHAAGFTRAAATDGTHHARSTADGGAERCDLPITGMSCSACARRVEQSLPTAPGVRKAIVNWRARRAGIEPAAS